MDILRGLRAFTAPDGSTISVSGRSLLLVRNVGHLMTTPAVFDRNGNLLAAHPENPDVIYFVFGTFFQDYGTDIYRYDAASGQLTVTHSDAFDDVGAISFSPASSDVMYLGLISESPS